MWTFIARRLLAIPPLLVGVSLITFTLLRLSGGDFFYEMEADPSKSKGDVLGQKAQAGLLKRINDLDDAPKLAEFEAKGARWKLTPEGFQRNGEAVTGAEASRGLGKFTVRGSRFEIDEGGNVYRTVGAIEGYLRWVTNAVKLDFGRSFGKRREVFGLIMERLWNTLTLSLAALFLAWGLAIPLGVFAAIKPNSIGDHLCGFVAFFGLSIPSVFFALLMVLFASTTGWFPIGDMRDAVNYDSFTGWEKFLNRLHHLVLPTIVIGTGAMAGYMRQARGNMVEALSQDYVRTARAKGLPQKTVLFKHALRNAINPLVTLFGYSLAALLTGSFLVEVVMNWPGMARLVVDAIIEKDEPLVMASVLMSTLLLIAGNLLADLLLAAVDPRVRLS